MAASTSLPPTRAVVLSGGGARGAYEAGVLHYVLAELPKRFGRRVDFDLVLGTSVGAIHACYLAATADRGRERTRQLRETWLGMELEEFFRLGRRTSVLHPLRLLAALRGSEQGSARADRLLGVFDTSALEEIVLHAIPWRRIRRNLAAGHVRSICVAATQLATGRVVLFAQGQEVERLEGMPDPNVTARPVDLQPGHALASAAIPGLFPAVRVEEHWYVDGGLRLNTPLAPAVHLGADRILVIALESETGPLGAERPPPPEPEGDRWGSSVFLYGSLLRALMLDHLEADLGRMHFVNGILRQGEAAFGAGFLEKLNAVSARERGRGLRVIQDLVVRPSRDPSSLALEVLREQDAVGRLPRLVRASLGMLGRLSDSREEDLLSYLLFDGSYTETLFDLGVEDARRREDELATFFSDPAC